MSKLIIAIPRGRIIEELKTILKKTSFAPQNEIFDDKSRKLTFLSKNKDINFIKVRAFDACTFVAFGAAQIGIAGGSIDKSWILIRAYTMKVYGYDLAKYIEPAYAAPPLINGMVQKGELDGALNYWNYTARLKALNFRKIISVEDILPEIGIGKSLPLIGYVFSQKWAKNNRKNIKEDFCISSK